MSFCLISVWGALDEFGSCVLDMVIDGWNLKSFQSFTGRPQRLSGSCGYSRVGKGAAV